MQDPNRKDPPWYEEYFDDLYLRSYAPIFAAADPEAEVDRICRELSLGPGARVLDLCCGQGRHAVPLARRGLRVTGQDLSRVLLEKAREAAAAAAVDLELVREDMREIRWTSAFDAVVCLLTAFGYLEDDAENLRVLDGVARALVPGGGFVLDVINAAWLFRHWEATGWMAGEGGLLRLEERGLEWERGVQTSRNTFVEPDGRRSTRTTRLRIFLPHEIVSLLERAGLETVKLLGGYAGEPVGLEAMRLIAIARKPAL